MNSILADWGNFIKDTFKRNKIDYKNVNLDNVKELDLLRIGVHVMDGNYKVYKKIKCFSEQNEVDRCIATMILPPGSFVTVPKASGTSMSEGVISNKMRTDKAHVVKIECSKIKIFGGCQPIYGEDVLYFEREKIVPVNGFDKNIFSECEPGIHFFRKKDEALRY